MLKITSLFCLFNLGLAEKHTRQLEDGNSKITAEDSSPGRTAGNSSLVAVDEHLNPHWRSAATRMSAVHAFKKAGAGHHHLHLHHEKNFNEASETETTAEKDADTQLVGSYFDAKDKQELLKWIEHDTKNQRDLTAHHKNNMEDTTKKEAAEKEEELEKIREVWKTNHQADATGIPERQEELNLAGDEDINSAMEAWEAAFQEFMGVGLPFTKLVLSYWDAQNKQELLKWIEHDIKVLRRVTAHHKDSFDVKYINFKDKEDVALKQEELQNNRMIHSQEHEYEVTEIPEQIATLKLEGDEDIKRAMEAWEAAFQEFMDIDIVFPADFGEESVAEADEAEVQPTIKFVTAVTEMRSPEDFVQFNPFSATSPRDQVAFKFEMCKGRRIFDIRALQCAKIIVSYNEMKEAYYQSVNEPDSPWEPTGEMLDWWGKNENMWGEGSVQMAFQELSFNTMLPVVVLKKALLIHDYLKAHEAAVDYVMSRYPQKVAEAEAALRLQ